MSDVEYAEMMAAMRADRVLAPLFDLSGTALDDAVATIQAAASYWPVVADDRPSGIAPDDDLLTALGF